MNTKIENLDEIDPFLEKLNFGIMSPRNKTQPNKL